MAKNYEHLSAMERALIQAKLETGCKVRAIARSLQRSASTISRELKRCGWHGQSSAAPRLRTRGINGYWCEVPTSALAGWPPNPAHLANWWWVMLYGNSSMQA